MTKMNILFFQEGQHLDQNSLSHAPGRLADDLFRPGRDEPDERCLGHDQMKLYCSCRAGSGVEN